MGRKVKCPRCNGKGTIQKQGILGKYGEKTCPNCNGKGFILEK